MLWCCRLLDFFWKREQISPFAITTTKPQSMWLIAKSKDNSWPSVECRIPKCSFYKVRGKAILNNCSTCWSVQLMFASAFGQVGGWVVRKAQSVIPLEEKEVLFKCSPRKFQAGNMRKQRIKPDTEVKSRVTQPISTFTQLDFRSQATHLGNDVLPGCPQRTTVNLLKGVPLTSLPFVQLLFRSLWTS